MACRYAAPRLRTLRATAAYCTQVIGRAMLLLIIRATSIHLLFIVCSLRGANSSTTDHSNRHKRAKTATTNARYDVVHVICHCRCYVVATVYVTLFIVVTSRSRHHAVTRLIWRCWQDIVTRVIPGNASTLLARKTNTLTCQYVARVPFARLRERYCEEVVYAGVTNACVMAVIEYAAALCGYRHSEERRQRW